MRSPAGVQVPGARPVLCAAAARRVLLPASARWRGTLPTAVLAVVLLLAPPTVQAQAVLDRIVAHGAVRCAAAPAPGLASAPGTAPASGVFVDLCMALATAVLGPAARSEFHSYVSEADFARVTRAQDDVVFLSGGQIAAHTLAGYLVPGPAVFLQRVGVLVPGSAPTQHLGDLAGRGICYLIGDSAERALEAAFDARHLPWLRHAYSEQGEMSDAYAAGRCQALAGDALVLAPLREGTHPSRWLPEVLEEVPIVAATPTGDGRWTAIVAWTINTLVNAQRPATRWTPGGIQAMPIEAPQLGLAPGWQAAVIAATGNYRDICARHLGAALQSLPPADRWLLPFVE